MRARSVLAFGSVGLAFAFGLGACAQSDPLDGGTGGASDDGTSASSSSGDGTRGEGGNDGSTASQGGNDMCGTVELCDGIDNTCDGQIDEECDCIEGETQPCFSGDPVFQNVGACTDGMQTCDENGKWGTCAGEVLPGNETCDDIDNDCDGATDEGFEPETCGMGACQTSVETCIAGQIQECIPLQPPDPNEDCEGTDDDCDGMVDEGCACQNGQTQPCYTGPNGTQNVGICSAGTQTCVGGQWGACVGQTTPASETCDAIDQDCDGNINEGSCSLPNAVSSCSGGGCTITGCNSGYSNCDTNAQNGCETQHTGYTNASPGEFLGSYDADAVYGFLCDSGGTCEGPILNRQGTRGRYFNIQALESSSCCAYTSLRFELVVPPGVDYDLYLSGTGCSADPAWQSINGAGTTENIVIWCDDACDGDDDSFNVNVEVRHWGGTSCTPWTLNVYRRNC